MQKPNEKKRKDIINAAAKLFATRPFHEVRLDDVAAAARVGKGTLYIYFKNKDDLYISLIRNGFSQVLEQLNQRTVDEAASAWEILGQHVKALVGFAWRHPHFYELTRAAGPERHDWGLKQKRNEFAQLVERAIRLGVERGEFIDPYPALTSQFIPSLVRAAMLYGPRDLGEKAIAQHILQIIGQGLLRKES